jgi:hypothetical protein
MSGFIGTSLQFHSIITAHIWNSCTTSVWRMTYEESRTNLSLISDWSDLYYPRIHECTAFYNSHATEIEVTISNSSFVLVCCHGNLLSGNDSFVAIYCSGNVFPSRCSATDVCSGSTIPAFSRHVIVLWLEIWPGVFLLTWRMLWWIYAIMSKVSVL